MSDAPKMRVKLLHPNAKMPTYATDGSTGLDLYACEDALAWGPLSVKSRGHLLPKARVRTGVSVEIPDGHVGLVRGRSGLAFNHGVTAFEGTIDADYRGEIAVLLYALQVDEPFRITAGDRIAQLVIVPVARVTPVLADELSETVRGTGGFGSTGR